MTLGDKLGKRKSEKNMSLLYQLHWQFENGLTEVRRQFNLDELSDPIELHDLIIETQESHPLPAGARWMMCDEASKHFAWTARESQ